MLRAVLYISDSTFDDALAQEQLEAIHSISKMNNNLKEISGVLAYYQKKFFHVLEGNTDVIEHLLKKINTDKRNKNLSIALDTAIESRIYTDWNLVQSHSKKQSKLLSQFLQRSIDTLPMLEQQQHDCLEEFVNNIFY